MAGLKDHLAELIEMMGGKVTPNRIWAKVWIFYKDNEFAQSQQSIEDLQIKCHFSFITECFYANGLLDATQFEIQKANRLL